MRVAQVRDGSFVSVSWLGKRKGLQVEDLQACKVYRQTSCRLPLQKTPIIGGSIEGS
jgi:hypothetical protein